MLQDKSVLASALTQAGLGYWLFDLARGEWQVSARARQLLGLAEAGTVDRNRWLAGLSDVDRLRLETAWNTLVHEGSAYDLEFILNLPEGERWIRESIALEADPDGEPRRLVGVLTDMTDQRQQEADLLRRANYDSLTGLPNRAMLDEFLRKACTNARRRQERMALLVIDLDRFKEVNDQHGHLVGDRVLQAAARRMESCLRISDMVARQGGDEFIAVLQNVEVDALVGLTALRLIEEISRPYLIDGHEIAIGASVGIALVPTDGGDVDTALGQADSALYDAKRGGRETLRFFEDGANAEQI